MKKIFTKAIIVAIISTSVLSVFAQDSNENLNDPSESVTIRKTGPTEDKMTIVIEGNNVTVNGIPVENFKSENVEVTKGDDQSDYRNLFRSFSRGIETNKAFLGVMTKASENGALIQDVTENSPASKAGLLNGDIITKVNEDKISDANDLYKAIGKYNPEDKITITYLRDGKESTTEVVLAKNEQVKVFGYGDQGDNMYNFRMPDLRNIPQFRGMPFNKERMSGQPKLGLQVQDMQNEKGVKVLEVMPGLPGDKTGIEKDDIIINLNGKEISGVDDVQEALQFIKSGDTISVTYLRNGKLNTATINFPKKLKTTDI